MAERRDAYAGNKLDKVGYGVVSAVGVGIVMLDCY